MVHSVWPRRVRVFTDTIETYFDSRLDLLERRLKKHGDMLKIRAEEALKKTKTPIGEFRYSVDLEKEMQKFKLRVRLCTCRAAPRGNSSSTSGIDAYDHAVSDVAVHQGRSDPREDFFLPWRHGSRGFGAHVWSGTRVRARSVARMVPN